MGEGIGTYVEVRFQYLILVIKQWQSVDSDVTYVYCNTQSNHKENSTKKYTQKHYKEQNAKTVPFTHRKERGDNKNLRNRRVRKETNNKMLYLSANI